MIDRGYSIAVVGAVAGACDSGERSGSDAEDEEFHSAEDEEEDEMAAEEHCGLTSDESDASSVSSLGVGSIIDAEQSEPDESSAEEELQHDECSACDEEEEEDQPGDGTVAAQTALDLLQLVEAGRRARAERLSAGRDAPFLAWQAERAAARRAASGSPSSDTGGPAVAGSDPSGAMAAAGGPAAMAAASAVAAGGPAAAASPSGSSCSSTPTTGASTVGASTAGYALERPRALPLLVADDLDERRAQVAELVARDPRAAVWLAREIFRRLPTVELPAEADRVYGALPMPDETVERPTVARASPAAPPRTLGARRAAGEPFVAPRRPERCACCDAQFGDGESARCPALQMLAALADDLAERDAIVERELDQGYDEGGVHRAARWFLYRQCIALQYGHLGRGVRIKLPDCVVGAIRSRWREPSCTCATIAELAACRRHGYAGFRAV
jgi:hypothetical protein